MEKTHRSSHRRFQHWLYFLLAYTLLVIVWGAWVRISRSGDGCGVSWPLCQGEVIPSTQHIPTWVEFSHRLSSGLFGFLVLGLFIAGLRLYPKSHPLRVALTLTLVLTISEALIGARLVLAGLVGDNASLARALTMMLHMVNSLFLVGSVTVAGQVAAVGPIARRTVSLRRHFVCALAVVGFFVIACSGAIAALAGTLFPSESLISGLLKDLAQESHFLVRWRLSHPLAATALGLLLAMGSFAASLAETNFLTLRRRLKRLAIIVVGAMTFGYVTLFSLSPTWMKLSHLLIAHIVWIALVLVVVSVYTVTDQSFEAK